jgi:hypothetical protein
MKAYICQVIEKRQFIVLAKDKVNAMREAKNTPTGKGHCFHKELEHCELEDS